MSLVFQGITINGAITVSYPPTGQIEYTTAGSYSWTVPDAVYSISAVTIGAGGGANSLSKSGGAGGGLAYGNDITVTPGQTIYIRVGENNGFGAGGPSYISPNSDGSSPWLQGGGGGKGNGPSVRNTSGYGGGGGGAGGYATTGGDGGDATGSSGNYSGSAGGTSSGTYRTGGFAGGTGGSGTTALGGYSYTAPQSRTDTTTPGGQGAAGGNYSTGSAWGGGGVGLYGADPTNTTSSAGSLSGEDAGLGPKCGAGEGGNAAGDGQDGGVRIIWPGNQRQYPSTRTADE